ncbi:hypothetical protein BDD12DRAFT_540529 [Trichophaea hybrida]|nr:hypothetical protein BDD12DRAFT_540529 [Trichophaea hybrida]
MAQTMKPPTLTTKDASTDPKTPTPPLDITTTTTTTTTTIPSRKPRDFPRKPREQIMTHAPPDLPRAQQSKKRKLASPPSAPAASSRFPHLPSLPSLALSPPPPPPPKPTPDPLTLAVAAYRTTQSRRAADITIALKHRSESQEMILTHERWSHFSRGPEIARLDLLRTLDDAIAADREILRIVAQELRDTLEARERVGGIVDRDVEERAEKLVAVQPVRRVVGRRRGWGWGWMLKRLVGLMLLAAAAVWVYRTYLL